MSHSDFRSRGGSRTLTVAGASVLLSSLAACRPSIHAGSPLPPPIAEKPALAVSPADPRPAGQAPEPIPAQLSLAEKLYGLGLFWREATYNFAYFDQVPDLDWDKEYMRAVKRVVATENDLAYYRELQRFAALLEDGHTGVYLPRELALLEDRPPLRLDDIGGEVVVVDVARELEPQVPVHSIVIAVDGRPIDEIIAQQRVYVGAHEPTRRRMTVWGRVLAGPVGSIAEIDVVTPEGERRNVRVSRNRRAFPADDWTDKSTREDFAFEMLPDRIARVSINTFENESVADAFASHIGDLRNAAGVLIDLRGNGGGSSAIAARIAEQFIRGKYRDSASRTRRHVAAYKAWGQWAHKTPAYEKYRTFVDGTSWLSLDSTDDGPEVSPPGPKIETPLVVLVGPRTASAAEDFLVMLDSVQRAYLVGGRTFGSTGQPMHFRLHGGGWARICTKRDEFPDGRQFVGFGIIPHEEVASSVVTMRTGRDVVLERGLEVLRRRVAAGRRAPSILPTPNPSAGLDTATAR